jgi:hypothetical protein
VSSACERRGQPTRGATGVWKQRVRERVRAYVKERESKKGNGMQEKEKRGKNKEE